MTKWFFLLVVAGLAVAGWYNRDKISAWIGHQVSVETTPAPVTPHPALDSRTLAVKAYPALGLEGSTFNKKFLQIYNEVKEKDPAFLGQPDWPMQLAERTARELGVVKLTPPSPTPAWTAQTHGSLLDMKPAGAAVATVAPTVQLPGIQGSLLDQRPVPKAKGTTPPPH